MADVQMYIPIPVLFSRTYVKYTESHTSCKQTELLLTAGHIYVTDCKKGLAPRGLGFLKDVCSTVNVPVYAIGGIKFDEKQWEELKQNGASGGCIMSGMMEL